MSNIVEKIQVLLVEDSMDDAELTIRALRKSKIASAIAITHLKDGAEAVDYFFDENGEFKKPAIIPKVILLDLKLPKIDGIAVLQKLKSHAKTKSIPIVVLTSSQEEKDIVESYNLGVNSFVTKPMELDSFMNEVADLGLYWGVVNQSPIH